MQGNILGLILSIVASLIVAVSFYWAITTNETTSIINYRNETVTNRQQMPVEMTITNSARWGSVPGDFGSSLIETINVQFYSNEFLNSHKIVEMARKHAEGESAEDLVNEHFDKYGRGTSATYTVNRTITPFFNQSDSTSSMVTYTPSIKNTEISGANLNAQVPTVNYEGLNLWWQMQNLPRFMQAWQAFSQITNKMTQQPFQNFFYAHFMYAGNFDNVTWVQENVFGFVENATSLDNKTIEAIYSDTRYGMASEQTLSVWIAAAAGDMEAQALLQYVWFSGKYQLPAGWMANITAVTGKIPSLIGEANSALISQKIFSSTNDITAKNMAAYQWANGDLLNNPALVMNPDSADLVPSVRNIGMNFMTQPEITQSGCDVNFTMAQAEALFNQDLEDGGAETFLNPTNYWTFQHQFANQEWSAISGAYGLDQDQATCIYNYANQQGSFAPYQAYGNMLTQGVMSTINNMTTYFPINLAARTMGYRLAHGQLKDTIVGGPNGTDWCQAMVAEVELNDTRVIEICTNQDFLNVNNLQEWIAPIWYNDYTKLQAYTGWTTKQCSDFYNNASTNNTNFGYQLQQSLTYNWNKYDCQDESDFSMTSWSQNCSAQFLAYWQWGSSKITLDPPYDGDYYYFPNNNDTNETLTILTWGVPGIVKAPEYFYYSQFHFKSHPGIRTVPALTFDQVSNVTGHWYTYYGLGMTYNAKNLYYNYITNQYGNPTAYINQTVSNWGLNTAEDVYQVLKNLDWLIQDYVLGGLTANYTANDMVFGWNSDLIDHLEFNPQTNYTNRFFKQGDAIYYTPKITPFIHGNMWSMASNNPYISVNTGYPTAAYAGRIENMNGLSYPNIPFKVYDGFGSSNYLPFPCSEANFTETDVYTWQQNQPGNEYGTEIITMNMMNMQLQHQVYQNVDYICANGTGNASCNGSFDSSYNSFKETEFFKNSTFTPVNNCGTRIFSHGYGAQTTIVDINSGLSTAYQAEQQNVLSWTMLTVENPENSAERIHLHPFPALKLLYDNLGTTLEIPLGGTRSQFNVQSEEFVNLQYPVNPVLPTKTVEIAEPGSETSRKVVVWVVIVYSLLLLFFIILAVGFASSIHKAKQADASKANHVLYDNLNKKETADEDD